ncbi:MAG TPA: helix-turn-helix domain-containing protein [Stellaceae bacterium]|nr:helix-turn-helix domain-containing protein [Stellaceae bacterium]
MAPAKTKTTKAKAPKPVANSGRRELNKRDKLARIRNAARALFIEKGFDDTTTREIALRAGVAIGTLFLYASDKRDLLLLLFDEELNKLSDRAVAKAKRNTPFIDQLLAVFRVFLTYFGETPRLSRYMMQQVTFMGSGVGDRIQAGLERTHQLLAAVIAQAQADGLVNQDVAPLAAAELVFLIYRAEIRRCLANEPPRIEDGIAALRRDFTILFEGMRPRPGPSRH